MIFNIVFFIALVAVLGVIFGVIEKVFDFMYENVPAFKKRVNSFMGM
jgi:hypothetical protein